MRVDSLSKNVALGKKNTRDTRKSLSLLMHAVSRRENHGDLSLTCVMGIYFLCKYYYATRLFNIDRIGIFFRRTYKEVINVFISTWPSVGAPSSRPQSSLKKIFLRINAVESLVVYYRENYILERSRCTYLAKYRALHTCARHVHARSRTIILISKNHHETVCPYAHRHVEQYCGIAHCSTEDADIIEITIVHFTSLTRARKYFTRDNHVGSKALTFFFLFKTFDSFTVKRK
ncbi:hypothetical protein PUN28_012850 [Cardiocondyla obscurior]|uniref:Uncharacterized protein n=1 Tax=Cardiocondyla obscurior TaxID=286306 RepID=A0AAW2F6X2_9HYME